jgi:hypothetical protein
VAQYRYNNPYNAGFALPSNVMAEPPGRGTLVSDMLPRGTISTIHGWTGGYEVPEYIRQETPGRGARTTAWLPRGTIPLKVPDALGGYSDEAVVNTSRALERQDGPGVERLFVGPDAAEKSIPTMIKQFPITSGLVALGIAGVAYLVLRK